MSSSRTVVGVTQAPDQLPDAHFPRDQDAVEAASFLVARGGHARAYALLADCSFDNLSGTALAHALSLRGIAALSVHDLAAATDDLEACVAITPDDSRAWINLSIAYGHARRYSDALGPAARAATIAPADHAAAHNLAVAFEHAGRVGDAVRAFEHACVLAPENAKSREGFAIALEHAGRFDEAELAYVRASELDPSNPSSRMKHGMLRLLVHGTTHQPEAWSLYESRIDWMKSLGVLRRFSAPRWNAAVHGPDSHVVVYGEQGLGDAIQFARFLPELRRRCSRLILTAKPEVASLLGRTPGIDIVIPETDTSTREDDLPPHDAWIPLLSIPHELGSLERPLPTTSGLLGIDPAKERSWQPRLAHLPGVRVGIVWAGSALHHNDHNRSIDLRRLEPLSHVPGVSWISLQKGLGAARDRGPRWSAVLNDWTADLADMADTAALIRNLDLVICVDTSVCHLAATLGTRTWTLLPWVPDWRWGLSGEATPWYPTMRLFRQPSLSDWESVAARLASELSGVVSRRRGVGLS